MQKCIISALISLGLLLPVHAAAQFSIDNPPASIVATLSGGSFIGGWHCNAETSAIVIRFTKNGESIDVIAGTGISRGDTMATCGDDTNGFGIAWNWNLFGDGPVTVDFLINGAIFASATVDVLTPGTQFLQGANGSCSIHNFPQQGDVSTVTWQEFSQGFQLTDVQNVASNGEPIVQGAWLIILNPVSDTCGTSDIFGADLLDITQVGNMLSGEAPLTGLIFAPSSNVTTNGDFTIVTDPSETGTDLPDGCTREDTFTFAGNFLGETSSTTQQVDFSGTCGDLTDCVRTFSGSIEPLDAALGKSDKPVGANTVLSKAMTAR